MVKRGDHVTQLAIYHSKLKDPEILIQVPKKSICQTTRTELHHPWPSQSLLTPSQTHVVIRYLCNSWTDSHIIRYYGLVYLSLKIGASVYGNNNCLLLLLSGYQTLLTTGLTNPKWQYQATDWSHKQSLPSSNSTQPQHSCITEIINTCISPWFGKSHTSIRPVI